MAPETPAAQALIVDGETGTVLFEKNADATFPPASLAKLATADVVADAVTRGEIAPSTTFRVTENAWRTGGAPSRTATMFAAVRSEVPVEALLRGLTVQGANDAAIVLAEGLAGTEAGFAQRMNERARTIGMQNSHFVNATGLPADGQHTTVRDMVVLANTIQLSPLLQPLYGEADFSWNGILQRNRNPLLQEDIGATGFATGFTEGAGYSIVAQTEREGRRTLIALAGLESEAVRRREAVRLLDWAQNGFERQRLFSATDVVARAEVFGGAQADVPLTLGGDLVVFVPKNRADLVAARIRYEGPLQAPVAAGAVVGSVEILVDGSVVASRALSAGEEVASGGFADRALNAVQELAFGWVRSL